MNGKQKAAALLLGLLLLVGCGAAETGSTESAGQAPASLEQQAEQQVWQPDGTMTPVSGSSVCSTRGDTAWLKGDVQVDGGFLWQAVDLKTGEREIFCAKKGCTHTDRSCDGWLELGNDDYLCPLPDGTLALLYGRGLPGEEEPLTLELRDEAGRVLRSASVEPETLEGVIYSDGVGLYLVHREYSQTENGVITHVLVRISLESENFGQKQEIAHWENDSERFFPGICTKNGILAAKTTFEQGADGVRIPMGGVLYELAWDGGQRILAQAGERQALWLPHSGQAAAFRYDHDTGMLEQVDLETGEYTLFAQLQPGLLLTEGAVFTDGWLFCNVSDGAQNDFTFAVQQGGQPQRSPLQIVLNGRQQSPVVRQALEGGRLLVQMDQNEFSEQYLDDDGKLTEGVTSEFLWGIFTPEQYLNGDTSYIMVESERGM